MAPAEAHNSSSGICMITADRIAGPQEAQKGFLIALAVSDGGNAHRPVISRLHLAPAR